ncbi:MAG: TolC family protein [Acidobacteriaceae bacterium]|nr:TolC family protein [Acidobacteriaceae bacterium]MBV9498996.1 TolC family protein [Acidobacteriaceae bacterium]
MNRALARLLALALSFSLLCGAQSINNYIKHRFNAEEVEVSDIEGLQQRIRDGKLHLRLRDFLELMLKNSPDIQITRLDVYTAANQVTAAKAPLDPTVGAQFNALRSVSPLFFASGASGVNTVTPGQTGLGASSAVNVILPATISGLSQNSILNYQQLLPTGQTFSANFSVIRSSGDGYPSPALFGALNFQLIQPLWQNLTNLQFRAPLAIARTQLLISSETSEAAIADAVAAAARQYWDAILARDNITVQEQTVDLAQKSYEHDKKALDLGALAKLDIYQSQSQVAERNRDLVQARYQYKVALDGLRRLIGADLTPALRETDVVLDDDPSALPPESAILPFEQALAEAMQARPEAKAAQQRLSIDALNARLARDQLKPQLNLSLQGGATGPGLNQITVGNGLGQVPNTPYPGLGPTLQQVLAFDFPSYGFGLQLNFPLRNSTAQSALANSLVSKAHDQYQKRQTQQQIIFDVRQALNSVELAQATISAAITARDLAQKNVEAEQQKYVLGSITAFELLDSQSRLANSQTALLNAYVTYQEAYVNYQRATWTLLDGFGIIVETPKVQ